MIVQERTSFKGVIRPQRDLDDRLEGMPRPPRMPMNGHTKVIPSEFAVQVINSVSERKPLGVIYFKGVIRPQRDLDDRLEGMPRPGISN